MIQITLLATQASPVLPVDLVVIDNRLQVVFDQVPLNGVRIGHLGASLGHVSIVEEAEDDLWWGIRVVLAMRRSHNLRQAVGHGVFEDRLEAEVGPECDLIDPVLCLQALDL